MIFIYIGIIILVTWTIGTYYVEQKGPLVLEDPIKSFNKKSAIIIFDPDPLSSTDLEICHLVKDVLEENGWKATLASVEGVEHVTLKNYGLFVFCVNEYNLGPDRITKRFISQCRDLNSKPVGAIILGNYLRENVLDQVKNLVIKSGGLMLDSSQLLSVYQLFNTDRRGKNEARELLQKWANDIDSSLRPSISSEIIGK